MTDSPLQLGQKFELDGRTFTLLRFCGEPNIGLALLVADYYQVYVPMSLLRSHLELTCLRSERDLMLEALRSALRTTLCRGCGHPYGAHLAPDQGGCSGALPDWTHAVYKAIAKAGEEVGEGTK